MEWHGYRGRVLDVDLDRRTHRTRDLEREEAEGYIGGSGLNARLLYDLTAADTPALSPLNPLIIGAGPFVGTSYPASARATITSISPLTGIFGDSNGGGFFGARLKKAGYDTVVVSGRADSPCYLLIDGENVSVEDAADLRGTETDACEGALRRKHRGSSVICIGPAGENLVSFACVMGNGNSCSFSRSGMGAVMGSKNLKAVVVRGGGEVPVHDPGGLSGLSRNMDEMMKSLLVCRLFSRHGTPMMGSIYALTKMGTELNGRRSARLRVAAKLGPRAFNRKVESQPRGCWNCRLRCHKHYRIKAGRYAGEVGTKHEVGYISPIGFYLGIHDLPALLHLVNVCNRLGMDVRDFAGVTGMLIDCLEHGIITSSELEGKAPTWGNVDTIEGLMHDVAFRRGFGNTMADGVREASRSIGRGAEAYGLHSKGMFMETNNNPLMMCAYSVATRGCDHLKGFSFHGVNPLRAGDMRSMCDATPWSMVPFSHRDKGRLVWWHENYKMLMDSLGTCFFLCVTMGMHGRLFPDELAGGFRLATGIDSGGGELMRAAERSYMVERAFNARRGMRRTDDSFVKRPERGSGAKRIDLEHPGMLDDYYLYRGLDSDGVPLPGKLRELGLGGIAADLAGRPENVLV